MKIAFLNKYQFEVARGAETFVFELAKRLSGSHYVDVIAKVNYLDLLKKKYDVIVPTNGRYQVFLTRLISWLSRTKMIVSGQSGAGLDDRINLYAFPDIFVGLTDYQCEWAKKINPFVKVVKIPNGVDLGEFNDFSLEGRVGVLSVGAFTKEKRHDLTIKAVAKLKNVKLIIAGGGGDIKDEIEDMGRKYLGKNFGIISVNHEQMPDVYRHSKVLAFPSVPWESFGIVLIEAMASGLPVVATNDPIRREIVGDAGILVNPENTKKYSEALTRALKADWGGKPRTQAEKFSWDMIALKYEELFKDLKK